jgi:hypothetical protein
LIIGFSSNYVSARDNIGLSAVIVNVAGKTAESASTFICQTLVPPGRPRSPILATTMAGGFKKYALLSRSERD